MKNTPDNNAEKKETFFKYESGNLKIWVIALMIFSSLYGLGTVFNIVKGSAYQNEIAALMQEMKDYGKGLLTSANGESNYNPSNYSYVYPGPRIMHELITAIWESEKSMVNEADGVKERTINDLNLYELNNPDVINEAKTGYVKTRDIIKNTYDKEFKAFTDFCAKIAKAHKENPKDHFLEGMYLAYSQGDLKGIKLSEELIKSVDEMFGQIINYLDFFKNNRGKYKFSKTNQITLSADVEKEYDNRIQAMQDATEKFNKAQEAYTQNLKDKMQHLDELSSTF